MKFQSSKQLIAEKGKKNEFKYHWFISDEVSFHRGLQA
jgi:hypothetical protein